jgi:regulator of sigma E protease
MPAIAFATILANLPSLLATVVGLGLLIAVHEFGHLVLARLMGMRVEVYSLGFGPRLWGFKRGDTDYRISAFPLGGYCRIAGFTVDDPAAHDWSDPGSFVNKPAWRRVLVIGAGPGVNWLAAIAIVTGLYVTVGAMDLDATAGTMRVDVMPEGPAALAGVQSGDLVLAVDGVKVATFQELIVELHKAAPEVKRLEVERKGARLELPVTPDGGRISVRPARELKTLPLLRALPQASLDVWKMTTESLGALAAIFHRNSGVSLAGPVGIVQQAATALKASLGDFVALLANISVGLAVFNFLPVPALDGGRLVFLTYEVVTRRRVNAQVEMVVNAIGALLLIAMLLGVTLFGDLGLGKRLFGK